MSSATLDTITCLLVDSSGTCGYTNRLPHSDAEACFEQRLMKKPQTILHVNSTRETVHSRRRLRTSAPGYRKVHCAPLAPHLSRIQRFRKDAWTCFEGPFGEALRASGPMAKLNPFRFSTKYQDDETDLLYYGYRYYNASTGRWLSRDPLEEQAGMNRYAFCNNEPTDNTDVLGLSTWGDVWENWKKLPQETWDSFCTTLDSKIKSHVQDYKTDRINGCKFACCPLPAAAFAAIAEVVLDKFFPKHVEKKCPAGRTCCNKVEDKGPVNYGPFYFTFETGPHIGENGHVTVGTVDITPLLEEYGGYKPTSVKTTCRFSGQITFDGEFKVMIGDCVK